MGGATQKQALAREVYRAELHVSFEEETVCVDGNAEQLGKLIAIRTGNHGCSQDN